MFRLVDKIHNFLLLQYAINSSNVYQFIVIGLIYVDAELFS